MQTMQEFTALELFVLLTVMKEAHTVTLNREPIGKGGQEAIEIEDRIIEKLQCIKEKHIDANTIVLREI